MLIRTSGLFWTVFAAFRFHAIYRDRAVFDCLRRNVLPELAANVRHRGDRTPRCWSAGGEEPYTLSIFWTLDVQKLFPEVVLSVIATDADARMLERARRGCFSPGSFRDFPAEEVGAAFLESDHERCVRQQFRTPVAFQLQDIRCEMPKGCFDLILIRVHLLQHELCAPQIKKCWMRGPHH